MNLRGSAADACAGGRRAFIYNAVLI